MSKLLSITLLASLAVADVTTSAWMPGMPGADISYVASAVTVSNDRTVYSISYQASEVTDDDYFASAPQTVTVGGETYYGFEEAATESEDGVTVSVTGSAACTRQNTDDKEATCVYTSVGLESVLSQICSGDMTDSDYCMTGAVTTTLPEGYFATFQLVVTAGEDLLPSASAAATPSASTGKVTMVTGSKSGSMASSTGSASNTAASATGAAAQSTAGAPMVTMAPALAGLGAAAAAFFL